MKLVYKYTNVCGADHILGDGTLLFTSLARLNDINEGLPDQSEFFEEQSGRYCAQLLGDALGEGDLSKYGVTQDMHRDWVLRTGLTSETASMVAKVQRVWELSRRLRNIGILSLTLDPANVLMWGHYGENGRGICVGFDEDATIFKDSEMHGVKGPMPVIYSGRRPKIIGSSLAERLKNLTHCKSDDWKYEQEVRCVRELAMDECCKPLSFEPKDVREVILGPKVSLANIERWHGWVSDKYSMAKFFVAAPNYATYTMDIGPALTIYGFHELWKDDYGDIPPFSPPSRA